MNVRKLAKERKIKYYSNKSRAELCKELEIENEPGVTTPKKITLTRVKDGKTLLFKSLNAAARAVDRNSASVLWYVRTKKPMIVYGPGLDVFPGYYMVTKV